MLVSYKPDPGELFNAIEISDAARVKWLLAHGADPHERGHENNTMLHFALLYDNTGEIAGMLIEAGADIEATNRMGMTPVMYAASRDNIEGLKLLLNKGADLEKEDIRGLTALSWAYHVSNPVAKDLIKKARLVKQRADEEDALRAARHDAAAAGQTGIRSRRRFITIRRSRPKPP